MSSLLLSDMLKDKENQQKVELEIPEVFPNILDWVIYIWAESAYAVGAKEVPMIMKVTSGDPGQGLIAGWAFTDPALEFKDVAGIAIQVPPMIPVKSAPYSSVPKKLHWLHVSDLRAYHIRVLKAASENEDKPES